MTTFQRNQNKRTYTIYYNVNCKSKCTIPLMESWRSWWNVLNVRLAETELKLRIKDHRKDVLKLNTIPAFRHVAQRDHDFDTHAKFTTIEQLQNAKLSKESITEIHKKRENFWIKILETLRPKGLLNRQTLSYLFFPFNLLSRVNAYRYQKSGK